MNRLGHATTELSVAPGAILSVATPFEVALDCIVCRRRHRTVVFSKLGAAGVCTPTGHEFRGTLLSLDGTNGRAAALFSYDYEPFRDAKYPGGDGFEAGAPSWARFNFDLTCRSCGAVSLESTQTNLVRPWSFICKCGAKLYDDLRAPALSWEHATS